jgi:hypothetical protein
MLFYVLQSVYDVEAYFLFITFKIITINIKFIFINAIIKIFVWKII